ncbi:DUF2971 domain-containing protein [Pseudomonas sp. MWU12-3103b]|uniref:DUF2971 domain-containing protein n=1 Tax=Pseudomonas sp. MWU12-3103b TaxID=2928857 RepID=UPI001FFF3B67|nr:DUF2971 domain-containing protein [Pseudomonas sp. MWU12-3103b]
MELHHYTDVNGLTGIIQRQALWATDIGFLNDSREMFAGIDLIRRRCDHISTIETTDKKIQNAIREFYGQIPEFVEKNLIKRNIYIISFSKARDNLRQWMSYCPKNAGYSIELDSNKVLADGMLEYEKKVVCRLEEVDYHEERINEILVLNKIFSSTEVALANLEQVFLSLANELFFHCCAVKPKEFYDEQETRLVIHSRMEKTHEASFRTRAGIIIPYFEYPIEHSSIKEITIGPNINMSLARKGLEMFLEKHSITCKVRESKCSLRNF